MISEAQTIVGLIAGALVGGGAAWALLRAKGQREREAARAEAAAVLDDARRGAARVMERTERRRAETLRSRRAEMVEELSDRHRLAKEAEREAAQREEAIARREARAGAEEEAIAQSARDLEARVQNVDDQKDLSARLRRQTREKLLAKVGTPRQDVLAQMVEDLVARARGGIDAEMRGVESAHDIDLRARWLMNTAFERRDAGLGTGKTTSAVALGPDGRKHLLQREGALLTALGEQVGVKLVVAESGDMLHFEGQDPLEREVAKRALRFLQSRQGSRVREPGLAPLVVDIRKDLDREILDLGNRAFKQLALERAHQEIVRLVGILNWRFSYGQNQWRHAVETAWLASMVAEELGLDVDVTRRAALLHDIGKSMTHAMDGGHAVIGADFARQYGEAEEVANAIGAHHGDEQPLGPIAQLVAAADAMSGGRPGARRESNDVYAERIQGLERIAGSFRGVEAAFALQGGREVRVYVSPRVVTDQDSLELSQAIATQVEDELTYPGQIKVTVIRETVAVDFAG